MKNFEIVNLTDNNIVLNINGYDYTIELNVIGDFYLGGGHAPDVYQIIALKNGSTKELDLCYLGSDEWESTEEFIDDFVHQLETIKFPKHFDDFDNYTAKFKWCSTSDGGFSEGRVEIGGSDHCIMDFFYRPNCNLCCTTTNYDGTKNEIEECYILTLFTLNEIVNDEYFTKK